MSIIENEIESKKTSLLKNWCRDAVEFNLGNPRCGLSPLSCKKLKNKYKRSDGNN
jgi:hypothetical protein